MSNKGYIYLDRKICDHWLWNGKWKAFSEQAAWIDILLSANFADSKAPDRFKNMETIKRGSFVTSIRLLGERWGWGKDRVSSFLNMLEADDMIKVRSDARGTMITVCNYSQYQKKRKGDLAGIRTCGRYEHRDEHKDGPPPLISNSSNEKERKEEKRVYDPLAGARKRYDDL